MFAVNCSTLLTFARFNNHTFYMKKLVFFALALSFFAACKNDPPAAATTPETTATTPAAGPAVTSEQKAEAVASYQKLNSIITEIDAMPAKVRNKPEVQAIRNEMGDISGKAEILMRSLDPNNAGGAAMNTATSPQKISTDASTVVLDPHDVVESMARYNARIEAASAKLQEVGKE